MIGNEEEQLGDEEEESSGSEDAPEGGQLPPEFLADIVDRLAGTLGQNEGLAGQFVQTYMMTVGGATSVGKTQTRGPNPAIGIRTENPNKDKGAGKSKGGGLGEEGARGEVAGERATGCRSSNKGYVEWKIEVLVIRSCPTAPNIKEACLIKASKV